MTQSDESFWRKVNRSDSPDGCWEWQGAIWRGYGAVGRNGKTIGTHRYSYILAYGAIPPGKLICHKCNNRRCVNPSHLYAGTSKDNHNDSVRAGTAVHPENITSSRFGVARPAPIGTEHPLSKLTEDLVRQIRQRAADGETHRAIAASLGIGKTIVTDVKNRKRWGWVD